MKGFFATAAAVGLALSMSTASAQSTDDSDGDDITDLQFEMDADGGVTMDSFKKSLGGSGMYAAWDANGDGMLSEDEFNAGFFAHYDADADGYWNADELSTMNNDAFWSGREKDGSGQGN